MEQLQTQLLLAEQIVIGAIVGIIFALMAKGAKIWIEYLKTKSSLIKDEKARKIFESALANMDNLITTNIVSAENTLKPEILKAIADGKVDKSELGSLSIVVKENVLKQLGTDATKVLNNTLGDTNSYLENKTEEILANLKADKANTTVNSTAISEAAAELKMFDPELQIVNSKLIDANAQLQTENLELKTKIDQINSALNPGATTTDSAQVVAQS